MSSYHLCHQSALTWLTQLGQVSVGLAAFSLTQQPRVRAHIKAHNLGSVHNAWLQITPQQELGALFNQLYRVLKVDRDCFVRVTEQQLGLIQVLGQAAGFRLGPLRLGQQLDEKNTFIPLYLLHFRKGRAPAQWRQQQWLETTQPNHRNLPEQIMLPLLQQCCPSDELVIDPILCDASLGLCALTHGWRFAGATQEEQRFNQIKHSLNAVDGATELMPQKAQIEHSNKVEQLPLL